MQEGSSYKKNFKQNNPSNHDNKRRLWARRAASQRGLQKTSRPISKFILRKSAASHSFKEAVGTQSLLWTTREFCYVPEWGTEVWNEHSDDYNKSLICEPYIEEILQGLAYAFIFRGNVPFFVLNKSSFEWRSKDLILFWSSFCTNVNSRPILFGKPFFFSL